MSSEDIPKVPERPVRKRTPSDSVTSETSSDITIPSPSNSYPPTYEQEPNSPFTSNIHHQRAQTTTPTLPIVPPTRPLLKAKTTGNIVKIETPQLPSKRPVKRSTTQNLDDLVQSTSEQLKEMEKLISKHGTASAEKMGTVVDDDATGEDATSLGTHKEQDSVTKSDLTPSKDHNESKAEKMYENAESGSQVDSTTSSEANVQQIRSDGQENELNLEEPLRSIIKPFRADGTKDIDTHSRVSPDGPDSEDTTPILDNVEPVHKGPEGPSSSTAIKVVDSQRHFPDNAETASDEGTIAQKPAVPSIPARPRRKLHDDDTSKYDSDSQNENESAGKNAAKEDRQEAPSVSESIESPLKPDTTKKRAAPPVPKKPSSRIAAFQEMLQKQQLEQLQGSVPSSSGAPSADTTDSPRPFVPRRPSHPNKSALNDEKVKFANNLNGLFPLPGMAPAGRIPASLSKKLGHTSSQEEDILKDTRLPDVHRKRGKGPRGRKLPSKVTNVQKITGESKNNEIEVFNTWNVVHISKRINSMELRTNDSPEAEVSQKTVGGMQGELNDGIQERRPSLSGTCLLGESGAPCEQEPFINEAESLKNNEDAFDSSMPYDIRDQNDADLRRTTTAEAIDERDQNGQAETLENYLEEQAEREFENEILADEKTLADTVVENNDLI